MPVNVNIEYGSPTIDFIPFLDLGVGAISDVMPSSTRAFRILKKQDILDLYSNNLNTPYRKFLFHLAGRCNLVLYNSYLDIEEEDKINIIIHNQDSGSSYLIDLINTATLASNMNLIVFAPLVDYNLVNLSLYPNPIRDHVAIFYGTMETGIYGPVWNMLAFIESYTKMFREKRYFCGLFEKTNYRYNYINKSKLSNIISNKMNHPIAGVIENPVLLSGKFISSKLVHLWIRQGLRLILKSFIGRYNGEDLWQDVEDALRKFGSQLGSYKCGLNRFEVIVDSRNNTPNSPTLYVEIQYSGGPDETTLFTETIELTLKLV
jgi:hypothetical protein